MRIARHLQLPAKSAFHFMWRCINGEMFMEAGAMKEKRNLSIDLRHSSA